MDFDYYFKKYDEEYGFNDSELCGFEIGFEAGQQSKQEEVNKLQEEVDVLKFKIQSSLNTACRLQYSSGERVYKEIKELLK